MIEGATGTVAANEWESGFVFPQVGKCQAFARLRGACAELRTFDWRGGMHEGSFATTKRFIELTDVRAKGGYWADEPAWRPLGAVRYYPGNRRFYGRWVDDRQTSLLCTLDLRELTGLDLEIDDTRLVECVDIRNEYLRVLMTRIRRDLLNPGFAQNLVLETACMAIAAELTQHFAAPPSVNRARGESLTQAEITLIGDQIRAGAAPATLAELAQEAGVGVRQFARLFRATTGEAVGRFCARQMLERGKDLLSDRTLLLKEVAYRCGFANTASFARAFRRETGLSPQQYRAELPHRRR